MATIQNYNPSVGFNIKTGFKKIYNKITSDSSFNSNIAWDLSKVIDFDNGDQVLVFIGAHDGYANISFIFANNKKNRKALDIIDDYDTGGKYIHIRVFDCGYNQDPSDRGKRQTNFNKVRAFKNVKDLGKYLWSCDWFDYDYSDDLWGGYDWSYSDTLFKSAYSIR